jgi:hypothetical protein
MLLVTAALAGCGSEVAEPRLASMKPMLARQPAPNCEYRTATTDKSGSRPTASDTDSEQQRARLDYERQCYRHAAIIARTRLRSLQDAVEKTSKGVKSAEASPPSLPSPVLGHETAP